MGTNDQLQQLNYFAKGIDSDNSDSVVDSGTYREARNLRLVTDTDNSGTELRLIEGTELAADLRARGFTQILATVGIRDYGVVIAAYVHLNKPVWGIFRFTNKSKTHADITDFTQIFGPCEEMLAQENGKWVAKVDINARYESEDNIKIYFTDGVHPLMSLNIAPNYDAHNQTLRKISEICAYPEIVFTKPIFRGLVKGSLTGGEYQYAYQLYDKFGRRTDISPCTKLITISSFESGISNSKKVKGFLKDKNSNHGIAIQLKLPEKLDNLNRIRLFRIHYVESGQLPLVELIYDSDIVKNDFIINDTGQKALQEITVEEFNSMQGIRIIPHVIDSKNDYMFAANTTDITSIDDEVANYDARAFQCDKFGNVYLYDYTDEANSITFNINNGIPAKSVLDKCDCYNKYTDINISISDQTKYDKEPGYGCQFAPSSNGLVYGGKGAHISWKFVVTEIDGDTTPAHYNNDYGYLGTDNCRIEFNDGKFPFTNKINYATVLADGTLVRQPNDIDASDYFNVDSNNHTYVNPAISYFLKSLKRDEVYRYGIVMYNRYSQPTPVKWIADIRVPGAHVKGFESYVSHGIGGNGGRIDLVIRPVGVQFEVKDLPKSIIAYEIVRCNRTAADTGILTQGILSRPISRKEFYNGDVQNNTKFALTPTGYITTGRYWYGDQFCYHNGEYNKNALEADNSDNFTTFQFICPEVAYHRDSMKQLLKDRSLYVETLTYAFGMSADELFGGNKDYAKNYDSWPALTAEAGHGRGVKIGKFNSAVYLAAQVADDNVGSVINKEICNDTMFFYTGNRTLAPYRINWYESDTGGTKHKVKYGYVAPNVQLIPFMYSQDIGIHGEAGSITNLDEEGWKIAQQKAFSYVKMYEKCPVVAGHRPGFTSKYAELYKSAYDNKWKSFTYDELMQGWKYNLTDPRRKYPGVIAEEAAGTVTAGLFKKEQRNEFVANSVATKPSYAVSSKVNDIAFTEDTKWDGFAQQKQSGDDIKIQELYHNNLSSIGGKSYCNWVVNGMYKRYNLANDLKVTDEDGYLTQIISQGGRSLLINLDGEQLKYDDKEDLYGFDTFSQTSAGTWTNQYDSNFKLRNQSSLSADARRSGRLPDKYEKLNITDISGGKMPIFLTDVGIFRPSVAGAYICNLRQTVVPYGGCSVAARSVNQYYSHGDYFRADQTTVNVFSGDCYIMPFEYVSMHKAYQDFVKFPMTACAVYAIPLETNINLAYTSGYEFSKHVDNDGITNIQLTPADVNGYFNQPEDLYASNPVHAQSNTIKVNSSWTKSDDEVLKNITDYRCYHSGLKTNNEHMDSWLKFQSSNFIDADTRYGAITNIRTFHNELMFWQECAFGRFSVNDRSVIPDKDNQPLILGNGGVLDRYDYTAISNGMTINQLSDTQSDYNLYWWDQNKKQICAYSSNQAPTALSTIKNVQNIINVADKTLVDDYKRELMPLLSDKQYDTANLSYDKKYNEVVCDIFKDDVLVYGEQAEAFTSLYRFDKTRGAKYGIRFTDGLYYTDTSGIYEYNRCDDKHAELFGQAIYPYLRYVVNKNASTVKTYDNIEFGGFFQDNKNSQPYDNSTDLSFNFKTKKVGRDNYQYSTSRVSDTAKITDREYDYRMAIPREIVDNKESVFGHRMRGKALISEMQSKSNSTDFSLQYITTKFRISWS